MPDDRTTADPRRDDRGDPDLLRAHLAGDRTAFETLVRRHRDQLWAVALRTMGDREEAADALQDALLSAYRKADRFRGDSAVTTWLYRIVVNACLDRMRRRKARPTVPLPETGPGEPVAPGEVADRDTSLTVQSALAELPVEQRAALVLVDIYGYPVSEAAQILQIAEGTVKSRCARGRARLAGRLGHLRNQEPAGNVQAETGAAARAGHSPAATGTGGAGPADSEPAGPRRTGQTNAAGEGAS
ncbi:MAG: RNA polymerase sigma factor SigM [Actinocatenispora sp.]